MELLALQYSCVRVERGNMMKLLRAVFIRLTLVYCLEIFI
jgi:hypothetical protein